MSAHFKAVDRQTLDLFPPSVEDWLPEKHLARFVVDVVSKLDLHELKMPYTGVGSEAFNPEMLLALLFYGYATGVFSSRKLEQATYDSIAFRYIAANTHPDHDTIATFRKRFLEQLKPLFLQILLLAKTLGFLQLGKISLDGSKIQANASKHTALSWGHAIELEQHLKEEVARLMALAEAADTTEVPDGMDIPAELARRDQRLKAIGEAKAKLEARAAERHAAEQAAYEAKQAERAAKAQATGRLEGVRAETARTGRTRQRPDQSHRRRVAHHASLREESPTSLQRASGSGERKPADCYRARHPKRQRPTRSGTDLKGPGATGPIVGPSRSAAGRPWLLQRGQRQSLSGRENDSLHAAGRERHHLPLEQRWADPPPLPAEADAVETMRHRLKTPEGRAIYGRRKCTVEPVFGIIKSVLGFRQFHLRGLQAVSGEWTLVSMAWNLKRMFVLQQRKLRA